VADRDLGLALPLVGLAGALARPLLRLGIDGPDPEDPGERAQPEALEGRPSAACFGQPTSDLVEILTFHWFDLPCCP
jgi:hypothetical protein